MPAAPHRSVTADRTAIARPGSARRASAPTIGLTHRRLTAAAGVVVALHLTLLGAVEWTVFQSVLAQAIGAQPALAAGLAATVWRTVAIELGALLFGVLAAAAVMRSTGSIGAETKRIVSVALISWSPLALYSAIILVAFTTGWGLDVPVFSSLEATDTEVTSAIGEAMPVIMQPVVSGRYVANGAVVPMMALLLHRWCGIGVKRSTAAAVVAGIVATLVRISGWQSL